MKIYRAINAIKTVIAWQLVYKHNRNASGVGLHCCWWQWRALSAYCLLRSASGAEAIQIGLQTLINIFVHHAPRVPTSAVRRFICVCIVRVKCFCMAAQIKLTIKVSVANSIVSAGLLFFYYMVSWRVLFETNLRCSIPFVKSVRGCVRCFGLHHCFWQFVPVINRPLTEEISTHYKTAPVSF